MQPDPWTEPDRRQVDRWRNRHELVLLAVGALVIGVLSWPVWLKMLACGALLAAVEIGHRRLNRRYDRMREANHAA